MIEPANDQPPGIDPDTLDLPPVTEAAERVRAFVAEWGDGVIETANGAPLYARDLEALARARRRVTPPPPPAGEVECCASGSCEVCRPGWVWSR